MSGPYAHITLVHELMRPASLESTFSISSGFGNALRNFFPYCVLGAVSPDYPNLVKGDSNAFQWADAMHYTRACEMITSGIELIRISRPTMKYDGLNLLCEYRDRNFGIL